MLSAKATEHLRLLDHGFALTFAFSISLGFVAQATVVVMRPLFRQYAHTMTAKATVAIQRARALPRV